MLQLNNIHKTFYPNTPDERRALHDVSQSLEPGDFVTIIGSNGAGKSTLLNMLAGTLLPDEGDVWIDGKDVTALPEEKRAKLIGRVFQNPLSGTAPGMTIEENMMISLGRTKRRSLFKGVTKKTRERFRELLSTLEIGLENRLNSKVGLLSGGERQALSLLMATFTEPKILLLDEHTAALDPSKQSLIINLTKDLVKKHKLTTVMVTHQMEQAIDLGNRLWMMDEGSIIFEANEERKKDLTVPDLLSEFENIRGRRMASDRALLAK
ncbi:ABC transporter ATP-binding protein [Tenuibacillus multivorans]|uniref:Putative ABC transport system ATP-binding protein n=1 Tax=Tenuibacillus multivorans TaxID=237069 RepID=A0A1H0A2C7_9BACI|nr:ATP-binding cassette domain-containing protein [Tenuibacillus multivorans]GEL78368.1 ABC transporter ATP-binding protein [Tenuibacillus multivorans]SDN27718.1 putative ABC transport system ATP-binding protein [Tenuibacillus multivorans]